MMILANYGIGPSKYKDPNSAKVLSKSLQIRTKAEHALKQHLKSNCKLSDNKRNDILNTITDYYNRVPFNVLIWNKYQVKQCIVDSILLLDSKFNPYRAKEAFENIEKMLINLIHQPWHKEFRKIYTYSGKFRSSICEPLIGVEEVFKVAGFEYVKGQSINQLVLPDDRMPQVDETECVNSVIFDCMLAQVILNNIIEIYQKCCRSINSSDQSELSRQGSKREVNHYSWIQAYFRERSLTTTDKACSNISELLNNITNHITRSSSIPFNNQFVSLASNSSPLNRNNSTGSGNFLSKSSMSLNQNSPKSSVQERTREFLAQQSNEDDNLLTIHNDLLRLPSNIPSNLSSTDNTRQQHSMNINTISINNGISNKNSHSSSYRR